MQKHIIIYILDRFADWEGAYVASLLRNNEIGFNHRVTWASNDKNPKRSLGDMTALPDITTREISIDADALILIGGDSWKSPEAKAIVPILKKFKEQRKVLGFICDAARFAACEGLLNDVHHTGNSPEEMQKEEAYTNSEGFIMEDVVADRNIVTANGNSPVAFATSILMALDPLSKKKLAMWQDFQLMGYWKALKKYGFLG